MIQSNQDFSKGAKTMERQFYCQVIAEALELEEQGREMYEQAYLKVKDPFARKALEFLIKEEERHKDKILRFNEHLFGRGEFDLERECAVTISEDLKKLIEEHVTSEAREKIEDARTDIDVYEIALDFEKRGYDFYKSAGENETDERIKRFMKFLEEEEVKHYELIQETIRYLKETDYYFEDFGGWIFA